MAPPVPECGRIAGVASQWSRTTGPEALAQAKQLLSLRHVIMTEPALRPGGRVCVTGASGYIASVLVAALKEKGYIVVGTVRDVERFRAEPAFAGVELFAADLLDAASFAAAFAGAFEAGAFECGFFAAAAGFFPP